jgi:hypothetical protein
VADIASIAFSSVSQKALYEGRSMLVQEIIDY